jgi:hypothetical protein
MDRKGLIIRTRREDQPSLYEAAQYAVGFWEAHSASTPTPVQPDRPPAPRSAHCQTNELIPGFTELRRAYLD